MKINEPKKLPAGFDMRCYACEDRLASHVCRYQMDELMVQVCLCDKCMQMDTENLLKNKIGIENPSSSVAKEFLST